MKYITVFGSAKPQRGDEEYEIARELGELIAKGGFGVVSGGYGGIMQAVSEGCSAFGGKAIGVTVASFGRKPNPFLSEIIETDSIFERIETLMELGDGFVVLSGGTGTLLELAVVWEMFNKGVLPPKPVAVHGEMWKCLIDTMKRRMEFEKRSPIPLQHFRTVKECFEFVARKE